MWKSNLWHLLRAAHVKPEHLLGGSAPASLTDANRLALRQWLPRSKMVPLGLDKTIDKIKMMEGRTSSIRKAVQVAFGRAMNHLSIVQDEPVSDLSDVD